MFIYLFTYFRIYVFIDFICLFKRVSGICERLLSAPGDGKLAGRQRLPSTGAAGRGRAQQHLQSATTGCDNLSYGERLRTDRLFRIRLWERRKRKRSKFNNKPRHELVSTCMYYHGIFGIVASLSPVPTPNPYPGATYAPFCNAFNACGRQPSAYSLVSRQTSPPRGVPAHLPPPDHQTVPTTRRPYPERRCGTCFCSTTPTTSWRM